MMTYLKYKGVAPLGITPEREDGNWEEDDMDKGEVG